MAHDDAREGGPGDPAPFCVVVAAERQSSMSGSTEAPVHCVERTTKRTSVAFESGRSN
ncbi:MAG TPA: hypothetical protein VFO03_12480 [Gaiellaceae bacterium]|nr:hypothetical protein [Gaiellaceae bacterium]